MADIQNLWRELHEIAHVMDNGTGRMLEELLRSDEMLYGVESQRLRGYCASVNLEPSRDLDDFGTLLLQKQLSSVEQDFQSRVEIYMESLASTAGNDDDTSHRAVQLVCDDLYKMRWGSTQVPIFSLLGQLRSIEPDQKYSYLDIAHFFIKKGVPADGKDVFGTTALAHSLSMKPTFDLEYAQILVDAGGEVSARNRHGSNAAHEIVQSLADDPRSKEMALESFEWFLSHGGNADVADSDGMVVRDLCESIRFFIPELLGAIEKEDQRRGALKEPYCAFCGIQNTKLLTCSRCMKARYCPRGRKQCQKLDWPHHKRNCHKV